MPAVQRGAPGGGTKQNEHGRRCEAARVTRGRPGDRRAKREHCGAQSAACSQAARPVRSKVLQLQGGKCANWVAPSGSTEREVPRLRSRRKYLATTRCGAAAGHSQEGPRGGHRMEARASMGPTAERRHVAAAGVAQGLGDPCSCDAVAGRTHEGPRRGHSKAAPACTGPT